ncbi:MAG TPA: PQQ-dependent sugar dehydrogenase [Kofleriaceae bacterium]|nr:PQQ-dependent sugar dehydrogenase [Kofleriaceae bacterium]
MVLLVSVLAACGDKRETGGLDKRPANPTCKAFTPQPPTGRLRLVSKFPGVTLNTPTGMFQRPGDNARWYVTEREGRLVSFPNEPTATNADVKVALDLQGITETLLDCSLSSVAFPPNFATSKRAYVSYCYVGPETQNQVQVRVSRFASEDGGLTFDPASEQIVVSIDHAEDAQHPVIGFHMADAMRFGPEGFLYIAFGDGGPQGLVGGMQAQDTNDLRGKLLRIDVSDVTQALPKDFVPGRQRIAATFPPDNPFANGGGHPAVWAYGFRNPWQWHFDRANGDIWLGDVGAGDREEINRAVVKGGNYGWSAYEGFLCTNDFEELCNNNASLQMPLLDYEHGSGEQQGNAVTGGLVYRGTTVPSLRGAYIFGDSSGQRIWAVRNVDALAPGVVPAKELLFEGAPVSAFAQDQNGELYMTILFPTATYGAGTILAVEESSPPTPEPGAGPPALLSQTGCFKEADPKVPVPAMVPFAPIAELFSDNATKRRWLALPDGKKIALAPDGDFEFPPGSVLVKEFSLGGKRIETRFFVRQDADARWAGYTYKWRADESDAELVGAASDRLAVGDQTWAFPSRTQCIQCHTEAAGGTLGPELAQLNHEIEYPATRRTANQLETLWGIGMLETPPGAPATSTLPSLAALDDTTRTLDERARSYLHANCAGCHRPNGPTFTTVDLRFSTTLANAGICDQRPTIDDLEMLIPQEPRLLAPGAPARSVLWHRMSTTASGIRMPPIARSLAHPPATTLIADWITATTSCPQ